MMPRRFPTLAGRCLRLVALVVPRSDRRRWLSEWEAELWQLENGDRATRDAAPTPLALTLGAVPHSLWERKEWAMRVLLQDVRFAVRVLARSPLFTSLAVLTVALGVGANTTIFSMTNATLLRAPAAITDPETVVQIGRDRGERGFDNLGYPDLIDFRDAADGLEAIAAHYATTMVLGRGDAVELVTGQLVTGDYFRLLGIEAAPGRVLNGDDDRVADAHPVVVISHALWSRRLGADPEVVGRELTVNGDSYVIVGVAARGFRGSDVAVAATDVWIPMAMAGTTLGPRYARFDDRGFSWLWMLGRLRGGASVTALQEELDAVYKLRYREAWGEDPQSSIGVLAGVGLRPQEREAIAELMTLLSLIVAVVLAVACANLANLLLARGIARSQEIGVRMALGAGRGRLIRQLLTESVLLSLAGGAVALLLTSWTARLIPGLLPVRLGVGFAPDTSVFAFALAISIGTGLLFGFAPAARAARHELVDTLREGSPLSGPGGWLRGGLVVMQLALSFVLLAGTGLLAQSLARAATADPGYDTRGVATVTLNATISGYTEPEAQALYRQIRERAAALPGVRTAGLGSNVPFGGWSRASVFLPEPRPDMEQPFVQLDWSRVTPGFLETLGIPLLSGSLLDVASAGADTERVAVISESAARLLFGEEDPLDRLIPRDETHSPDQSLRVIGVVGDAQMRSLQEAPRPSVYVPVQQDFSGRMTLFVRTEGDADSLLGTLRAELRRIDPELAIMAQGSLHRRMGASLRDTLLVARLAGVFGLLAFVLAGVGLYGVVAYIASTRTREVGVRMALGARARDVVTLFLAQAARMTMAGVAIGVALTLAAGGLLANLLYGVEARDPRTMVIIAIAVLVVSLTAAAVPARRATRISPVRALRQD